MTTTTNDSTGKAILLPAATPGWITAELVELTIRVWQPYYRETLSVEEAIDILRRTGALLTILPRRNKS